MQRLSQLLPDAQNDLAHLVTNDPIIGSYPTAATLALEPRFVLDDFANHGELLGNYRIEGIHRAGLASGFLALEMAGVIPFLPGDVGLKPR